MSDSKHNLWLFVPQMTSKFKVRLSIPWCSRAVTKENLMTKKAQAVRDLRSK